MHRRLSQLGQVLPLFALFLVVLLGAAALAVDYGSWLLTDRALQNVADHAALAGASQFSQRQTQGSCSGAGAVQCADALAHAWSSVSADLGLGLTDASIAQLVAQGNTPASGWTSVTAGGVPQTFHGHTIWVSTPPPTYAAYTNAGGRYASNFGIMFVRVDRPTQSLLGGVFGLHPGPRTGWATAGALPTDFALETFCRNNIAPESGVCVNSAGVTVDGQGGIRLLRGDIGSNESLTVSASTGNGVVVQAGNVFLVNRSCSSGTWNCPNSPPQGGISDGVTGKNAFYMAPLSVPHFASPLDGATIKSYDCSGASASNLCVPYKDQSTSTPNLPGDWICATSGSTNRCGSPTVTSGTVSCAGVNGGNPSLLYYPTGVSVGANSLNTDSAHPQNNGNQYRNIDDDALVPDPDTLTPPANPPTDYVYVSNMNINGSGTQTVTSTFTVNLGQAGTRLPGTSTIRYVAFKTNAGALDNSLTGFPVTLQVRLLPGSGSTAIASDPTIRTLTGTPTHYEFTVASGQITDYNSLRLEFTYSETGTSGTSNERGGGVSWAEAEHPNPQPATPPMIPPGYYRSIEIPSGGCAVLDPTAEYSSLKPYQMPGIYRFGGTGSPNNRKIKLNDGSYLIGDGVTLVFDSDWPDSGSNQGVAIGAGSALVLNTMRVTGSTPPCTPSTTETTTVNMSAPLGALPYSALCAAWAVDNSGTTGIHVGQNGWAYCDPTNVNNPHCVNRSDYNPHTRYRGITFYFTPSAWPPSGISNRFEMQGGSGTDPGLAFRGVMYAPYDDVTITGGNGFNTVGQVLAWTAKFNGGSAAIDLDYPYDLVPASPYLLEPTVQH
jgi:hypothetical protein